MRSAITLRTTLLGFLSWLLPFLASVPFFDAGGHLQISQPLFKSIMVLVGGSVGVVLLVLAFRRIVATQASALLLGLYWLAINVVLDLIVLVGLFKMPLELYAYDIGLRYLLIPIIAVGMGGVAREVGRVRLEP
jgi:hypothetical protein